MGVFSIIFNSLINNAFSTQLEEWNINKAKEEREKIAKTVNAMQRDLWKGTMISLAIHYIVIAILMAL